MLTKSKLFLPAVLLLAVILAGCELGYMAMPPTSFIADPVITAQPAGGKFTKGDAHALTVEVERTDAFDEFGYRWYRSDEEAYTGTAVEGATTASLSVSVFDEGIWFVYVEVTRLFTDSDGTEKKSQPVNSGFARVIINNPANAEFPEITVQPAGDAYSFTGSPVTPAALTVTAAVTDGGTLTYQWYSNTERSNRGGTAITGATAASYQPPAITAKLETPRYYYVVVTNTNAAKTGETERTAASSLAAVQTVNAVITVDGQRLQYVRGFGVMATFWYNSPQDGPEDYERMFSPGGLGYNILRVTVPVDNTSDPSADMKVVMDKVLKQELTGVRDRAHYFEIVKIANKYGGYVLASPWSPPPQWKTNNSINGGGAGAKAELKKEFWPDYGDYLKQYCKIMADNGAPIYAISIQNEPNFSASYDGCEWTGPQMRDFFKTVGRFTEGVKGFGGGNTTPRVLAMFGESANSPTDSDSGLNDPEALEFIDLFARHNYGSTSVTRSSQVQAKGREMWMTEHNINGGNATTYPNDSTYNYMWKVLNDIDITIRINRENAFIWWYGKRFYSMIGDGEYGTVDGDVLPRGWALSHYAKFAKETWQVGMSVSGTTGAGTPLSAGNFNYPAVPLDYDGTAARATAFMTEDGNSLSLVLFTPTNTGGSGGTDMGDIKIEFPAGFTATRVTAMRTEKAEEGNGAKSGPDNTTVLLKGGTAASVRLPAGQILSVRFTR